MKKTMQFLMAAMLAAVATFDAAFAADIGFTMPFDDWRTPIQIAGRQTGETYYEPVSVFTTNDDVEISFGWSCTTGSATLPPVRFAVYDENGNEVVVWTEPAETFKTLDGSEGGKFWSGRFACSVLKLFTPGDYMLAAELDPGNTFGETAAEREDNMAIFRFAVRDESLSLSGMLSGFEPASVSAIKGNDFAQEPHAAIRSFLDGGLIAANVPTIQFGPYVPMDGRAVTSRKKPLDLVIVIDTTGSMSGCINGLKANLKIFVDSLLKGDAQNDPIDDLRIKLVGFRDDLSDRNQRYGWFEETAFSQDATYLKNQLSGFKLNGGGGNGGESSYDALWYVLKEKAPDRMAYQTACVPTPYPFRAKDEAARAIILFTDEPSWCPTGRYSRRTPTTAIGAEGVQASDIVNAVEADDVFLTIITDSRLRGWSWGFEQYSRLAYCSSNASYRRQWSEGNAATNSEYIITSSLSTYASDTAKLRELAASVSKKVPTVVVEPTFSARSADLGTLSFLWKNDTAAGTNNVFRFAAYDGTGRASALTNITCTATAGWERVEMELGDGSHTFEWSYRKIGYEGAIVDAGLIRDLTWEPWATQLKLKPYEFEFECDTDLSGTVEVFCNETWTVLAPSEDWVHVSASGSGDGSFTFTLDPNTAHNARAATFRVRAGDHGNPAADVIVERTVTIRQKASSYTENGKIQIFDVGVKPRWPWNSRVDVDFRVVVPQVGTPVSVSLTGWDAQSDGFDFGSDYKTYAKDQRQPKFADVVGSESIGVEIQGDSDSFANFVCPSSGVYRVTWDLRNWIDSGSILALMATRWDTTCSFHSPEFKVILEGTANVSDTVKTLSVTSSPVRVDTRVGDIAGAARKDSGMIISRTEKIGHPEGMLDPFPWDSIKSAGSDGWKDLRDAYPAEFRSDAMTNRCLVLNDVSIEGGVITNDTEWMDDVVHIVRDNVYVAKGAKLTIRDGAVVKFCEATKIFAYWDSSNANAWNVEVQGAYLTDIYNSVYGGDTIFNDKGTLSSWSLAYRFLDQDFPQSTSDLSSIDLGYRRRGIIGVNFKVLDSVTTNENDSSNITYNWVNGWTRTYTRNQPFGNMPRPVGAGEMFLGWFYLANGDPKSQIDSKGYENLVNSQNAMVSLDDTPLVKDKDPLNFVYAVSDVPDETKYPTNYWPKADGGVATITLDSDSFVYDGKVHKPNVTQVKVDEVVVPPENYVVSYTDANGSGTASFTDAGVYLANVSFLYDYTNSPSASYVIQQAVATNAVIAFSPSYLTYTGSKLQKPAVTVRIGGVELPSSSYTLSWSDGDWTSVGKYAVSAEFGGNYEGVVSAEFEIKENPDLRVVFYDNAEEANSRRQTMESQGYEPRILYLSGSDAVGNAGIATRGIKKLLQEDVAVRSFVLTNFVCRYADYAAEGSNKCATAYAPEFSGDPLPFMGGISAKVDDRCLVWTNGYMSASSLLAFLATAATIPDMSLPVLPANATDEQVRQQIAKISWADPAVVESVTNMVAYTKFRDWLESLDDATREKLVESTKAYISSVVSEMLESPYLIGNSENVNLSITDFTADGSGSCTVTIELKAGDPLAALQLKAAKAAFAGKVRIGTSLAGLRPATESDISAAQTSGSKVVLTITMPSGQSGFIKMKVE